MSQLDDGEKDPNVTSGAPFPPAREHSDGPTDRPRRDVPTADTTDNEPTENEAEPNKEESP